MPDIQKCWTCHIQLEDMQEDYPFHCSVECRDKCKLWNYKPAIIENGPAIALEEVQEELSHERHRETKSSICKHKYTCKAHRDICMAKYGINMPQG